jgi:FkbM family methyltransferase
MLNKIRDIAASVLLNYKSSRRKLKISKEVKPEQVVHLQKSVDIACEWYGSPYGGFYIYPALLNPLSIVYSFGIGKDISFDLACIRNHSCKVFAFDPTPKSIEWIKKQKLPGQFHFHEYGISTAQSGLFDFYLPSNSKGVSGSLEAQIQEVDKNDFIKVLMKSFCDIAQELGHSHIDVLKMDIEGAEYQALDTLLNSGVTIDQILIEFHDRSFGWEEIKSKEPVQKLTERGYLIFGCSTSHEEISFIHKRKLYSSIY